VSLRAHEHGENELGARAVCVGRLAEMQRAHLRAAPGVLNSGQCGQHLGYHARGTYPTPEAGTRAYPVRTVRGALGASRPARPVRTRSGRLVRVARTYPTEAPGRTCQLRVAQVLQMLDVKAVAILVEHLR
jgi:hypothetical protein